MADEYETDPTLSGASRREPRGEDLASELLPEGESDLPEGSLDGEAADLGDDGEGAGESSAADASEVDEPYVDDPDELAAAEAEVDAMEDSEPAASTLTAASRSRRPKRRSSLVSEAEATPTEPEPTDEVESPGATAATASSLRPKKRTQEVQKKDEPTPSRRRRASAETEHRTGPIQFAKESWGELRKVVWPTGAQLWQYFVVVLVFVLFIILFVMGLDFVCTWLLLKFFG